MGTIIELELQVLYFFSHNTSFALTNHLINNFHIQHTYFKTQLASFAMRIFLHNSSILITYIPLQSAGNKTIYISRRFLQSNVSGIDITTCRLWYAMLMTKYDDHRLSMRIINKVLSKISPFTLYYTGNGLFNISVETKERYVDVFSSCDTRVTEKARRAWMFDLRIMPLHMNRIPTAIQIELVHCDKVYGVILSPFVCAYYLCS